MNTKKEKTAPKINKAVKKIKDAVLIKNDRLLIRLAGVISQVKPYTTKRGDAMLFASLSDYDSPIEIMAFSDVISQKPDLFKEGNVIIMEGRISYRNNEPKFICQKAAEL